jgi:hypothetical protein
MISDYGPKFDDEPSAKTAAYNRINTFIDDGYENRGVPVQQLLLYSIIYYILAYKGIPLMLLNMQCVLYYVLYVRCHRATVIIIIIIIIRESGPT